MIESEWHICEPVNRNQTIEEIFPNGIIWQTQLSHEEIHHRLKTGGTDNLEFWFMWESENLHQVMKEDDEKLSKIWRTATEYAMAITRIFEKVVSKGSREINGMIALPVRYAHAPVCPWWWYWPDSLLSLMPRITEIVLIDPSKLDDYKALEREYPCEPGLMQWLWRKKIVSRPTFYRELVRQNIWLVLSNLHPHLLDVHWFFQGKESPYRIDPERSLKFLWLNKRN